MSDVTDEELIGYLVDALGPTERDAVELYLHSEPAASARLNRLNRLLAPLEADRGPISVPAGLADRAISRLEVHLAKEESLAEAVRSALCEPAPADEALAVPVAARPLPRAPRDAPETRAVGGRFRPDLIVGFAIAFITVGLLFSAVGKLRARNEMLACQNTLRTTHVALAGYADANDNRYPQIDADATADSFVSALASAGQVPPDFRPVCPACSRASLTESAAAVGYTYTLGYRTPAKELIGPRRPLNRSEEHDLLPISADYPAAGAAPAAGPLCPHSNGMNVLYAGGNVRFTTSPLVGPEGDHIFQDIYGHVGAGANRGDVVLGRPGDRP